MNIKKCLKCEIEHNKAGKFCSRSCANSRIWSNDDKLKKSLSAKNSLKVNNANSNNIKRLELSIKGKKRYIEHPELFLKDSSFGKKISISLKKYHKIRLSNLDIKEKNNYKILCKFNFSLNNFPDEFDFNLIKTFGWYKAKNRGDNPTGISRDHMFSIYEGYKQNVDPYYISHPANCQLLQHNINLHTKGIRCSITLQELYDRVNNWNNKYK